MGRFAWRKEVHPGIGSYGPVVVLAASVYPGEGFFVQQAYQAMLGGHLLHYFHGKLVMVGGDVRGGIYRRKLMLRRGHLVVLCLCQYPKLPQFLIQLCHIGSYPGLYGPEVMVVQLLPLRRLCSE